MIRVQVSVASWNGEDHHTCGGSLGRCLEFVEEHGKPGTAITMELEASNKEVLKVLQLLTEGWDVDA